MSNIHNLFNLPKPTHSQRKKKRERYEQLEMRHQKAQAIKELFGKKDPAVRKQLVDIMKNDQEYKSDLNKMKDLFIKLNKKR